MDFNTRVILFLCVIIFNGILTGLVWRNLLPDVEHILWISGTVSIILCVSGRFILQFIQATFFDKKLPVQASENLLDFEGKSEKKLSDNKIWPYKLAMIFSFVSVFWSLLLMFEEF